MADTLVYTSKGPKVRPPQPPGKNLWMDENKLGELRWAYRIPYGYPLVDGMGEILNELRLAAISRQEEMLEFQKLCAKDKDIEGAKFFKEEAADARKEYRAACLILPHYGLSRGDCPYIEQHLWPVELAPWLDRVILALEFNSINKS